MYASISLAVNAFFSDYGRLRYVEKFRRSRWIPEKPDDSRQSSYWRKGTIDFTPPPLAACKMAGAVSFHLIDALQSFIPGTEDPFPPLPNTSKINNIYCAFTIVFMLSVDRLPSIRSNLWRNEPDSAGRKPSRWFHASRWEMICSTGHHLKLPLRPTCFRFWDSDPFQNFQCQWLYCTTTVRLISF